MAVYIDKFNAPYRRMVMCHMVADTHAELVSMALNIGVNIKWIQDEGTRHEHFDVCLAKKAKAIQLGAKEVSIRELAEILRSRDNGKVMDAYFNIGN